MNNDPWANIFDDSHQPEAGQSLFNSELSPLDQMRKELGEEYLTRSEELPKTAQLGEAYGEDVEFREALYTAVTDTLGYEPKTLYYPGSGEHVTLASAFPNARTIFSDTDGEVEHAFLQHNIDNPDSTLEFHRADMHGFKLPDELKADVTLILNAGYMSQDELDIVTAPRGIVIVNDWHDAYKYMQTYCPGYELVKQVDMGHADNDLFVFKRTNHND